MLHEEHWMRSGDDEDLVGRGWAARPYRHAAWCRYQDEERHACDAGAPDVRGMVSDGAEPPIVSATAWRAEITERRSVLVHVENRDCWADVEVDGAGARELAAQLVAAAELIEVPLREAA
ncbi:hypothetical protein ABZU76_19210 [Amycolatopsis sp. NPDC005232]|uniref:hypothetical protein n=1 Tax=Amycolatopsis sp. NPDC005232 TaxID=3157027 RepID=UPI0033B31A5E